MQFWNQIQSEAMHNMSEHQLPLYYQPQVVHDFNYFNHMIYIVN